MKKSFWKKVTGGLLTAALALSVAACGTTGTSDDDWDDDGSSTSASTAAAASASGTEGSTQTVSTSSSGEKVLNLSIAADPELNFDDIGDTLGLLVGLVREGLTRQGQDGKLTDGLAESYEHNDDYTQWTFHLRDSGYNDGTPVKADDWVYAITSQLDGTLDVSYPDFLYEIKNARAVFRKETTADQLGVSAPDDKTVVFDLEYPVTYFPQLITHPMHFGFSREFGEKVGAANVGLEADTFISNGPYYIDSWDHDDKLVLKKNEYYWNKDNINIDTINIYIIPDESTQVNMFLNGELDVVDFSSQRLDAIQNAGFTPLTYNNGRTTYLTYNLSNEALGNQNIRAAFSSAIDRQAIVDGVVKNGSTPADGLVPVGIAGDDSNSYRDIVGSANPYTYDTDKAQEYFAQGLAETGLSASDIDIRIITRNTDEHSTVSAAIQQILQEAFGITVEVDVLDTSSFRTKRTNYDYDFVYNSWGADWNDATNFLSGYEQTEDHAAATYYSEDFNEAYLKAVNDLDITGRVEDLGEAEKILLTDQAITPLYYTSQYYAVSNRVTGIERRAVIPYLDPYFADITQ